MIVLGLILLVVGLLTKIAVLWTIGIIVLVIGLVLLVLGLTGRAVGAANTGTETSRVTRFRSISDGPAAIDGHRNGWGSAPAHREWYRRVPGRRRPSSGPAAR